MKKYLSKIFIEGPNRSYADIAALTVLAAAEYRDDALQQSNVSPLLKSESHFLLFLRHHSPYLFFAVVILRPLTVR